MSRILLLNPPGSRNFIRDYFCSKTAKGNYKTPPVVLLVLSGILAQKHEVVVLDAMAESCPPAAVLDRIRKIKPDVVVALMGAVSWAEDKAFLQQVKTAAGPVLLVAMGDVLLEDTEKRLDEAQAIDAALLAFNGQELLAYIAHPGKRVLPNLVQRRGKKYISGGWVKSPKEFRIPCPRHGLFPLARYRFPFMLARPMTAMLTDYGCPFQCSFCVMPALGYGLRPLDGVLAEMRQVRALGVKEIFFLDQTFAARRPAAWQLCQAMLAENFAFHWSCFSRADVLDPELLGTMARAGCHTIILGIESSSRKTLARCHKQVTVEQIRKSVLACRVAGIRVAGTFLLGLPGETETDIQRSIRLSLELPLDFAAFNVAVPRSRTGLRAQAIRSGLITSDYCAMDQSGLSSGMRTKELSAEKIDSLRQEAMRRFYLRPKYWLRRLLGLRSWTDLLTQLSDAWGLVGS